MSPRSTVACAASLVAACLLACKPVPPPAGTTGSNTTSPPPAVECPACEAPECPAPTGSSRFVLVVEDVFEIAGRGTVVTGRVAAGTLAVGDEVTIGAAQPPLRAKVQAIEAFRKLLDSASEGDNVGLLFDPGVDRSAVQRGFAVIGGAPTSGGSPGSRFAVTLHCPGNDKVAAIKIVRELAGLSLADAKAKIEAVPTTVTVLPSSSEAQATVERFVAIGAAATVAPE